MSPAIDELSCGFYGFGRFVVGAILIDLFLILNIRSKDGFGVATLISYEPESLVLTSLDSIPVALSLSLCILCWRSKSFNILVLSASVNFVS